MGSATAMSKWEFESLLHDKLRKGIYGMEI